MIWKKLSNLQAREKLGLVLAALFAMVFIFDRLVASPILGTCRSYDKQIKDSEAKLNYNRSVLATEDSMYLAYRAIVDRIDRVQDLAQGIDAMKAQIDALAEKSGVILISREHRKPDTTNLDYQTFFVDVREFEASETNLVVFLRRVSEAPGLLRVVQMNLTPNQAKRRVKGSMLISKVMIPAETPSTDER